MAVPFAFVVRHDTSRMPAAPFACEGPVISGATLGPWEYEPLSAECKDAVRHVAGGMHVIVLPMNSRPTLDVLRAEHADWLAQQQEADGAGDAIAARDYGARAERAWRWMGSLRSLPAGDTFAFHYSMYRLGGRSG